jgi:hypothetical protein
MSLFFTANMGWMEDNRVPKRTIQCRPSKIRNVGRSERRWFDQQ